MEGFLEDLQHSLVRVEMLWKQIGWDDAEQQEKRLSLFQDLSNLVKDREEGFGKQKQELILLIAQSIDQIQLLCDEMGESANLFFANSTHGSLLKQYTELDTINSKLQIQRNQRRVALQKKQTLLTSLYQQIGYGEQQTADKIQKIIQGGPILSKKTSQNIEISIKESKEHKKQIETQTHNLRSSVLEISTMLDITGKSVEQSDDESLFKYKERLEQYYNELREIKQERTKRLESLQNVLLSLWNSLEEDADSQLQHFLSPWKSAPLSEHLLIEAQELIETLQENFRSNMLDLLSKYRDSISELWNQLGYAPEQYQSWKIEFFEREIVQTLSDDAIQVIVQQHSSYEATLCSEWEEVAPIHKAIRHRIQYIKKRTIMEEKAKKDPNRWKARGTSFLAEEAERKKIAKQIKMSEAYLVKVIIAWEESHQTPFMYDEKRYLDSFPGGKSFLSRTSSLKRLKVAAAKAEITSCAAIQAPVNKTPTKPTVPAKSKKVATKAVRKTPVNKSTRKSSPRVARTPPFKVALKTPITKKTKMDVSKTPNPCTTTKAGARPIRSARKPKSDIFANLKHDEDTKFMENTNPSTCPIILPTHRKIVAEVSKEVAKDTNTLPQPSTRGLSSKKPDKLRASLTTPFKYTKRKAKNQTPREPLRTITNTRVNKNQ